MTDSPEFRKWADRTFQSIMKSKKYNTRKLYRCPHNPKHRLTKRQIINNGGKCSHCGGVFNMDNLR